jgi:hypothetical protein
MGRFKTSFTAAPSEIFGCPLCPVIFGKSGVEMTKSNYTRKAGD